MVDLSLGCDILLTVLLSQLAPSPPAIRELCFRCTQLQFLLYRHMNKLGNPSRVLIAPDKFRVLSKTTDLKTRIRDTNLIITGEGRLASDKSFFITGVVYYRWTAAGLLCSRSSEISATVPLFRKS